MISVFAESEYCENIDIGGRNVINLGTVRIIDKYLFLMANAPLFHLKNCNTSLYFVCQR